MNRTIWVVIGVFFAVLFAGMILRLTYDKTQNESSNEFSNFQIHSNNGTLTVAWETEVSTDGAVIYYVGQKPKLKRDYGFDLTHEVIIEGLAGNITYYVESCDVLGKCIKTENRSIVLS